LYFAWTKNEIATSAFQKIDCATFDSRLGRIEHRLDLIDAPTAE